MADPGGPYSLHPVTDPAGRRPAKPPRQRFGWARRALVALMVVSFAVSAFAWMQIIPTAFDALTKTPMSTPGTQEMRLTRGRYVIFERTGSSSGGGGITFTQNDRPELTPRDVTIVGPTGRPVPTRFVSSNQTINQNGKLFTGVVEFDVTADGQHTVDISRVSGEVIVTRSFFDGQAGHLVLGVLSGITFVLSGVALLIATIVVSGRRSRARRLAWSTATPPNAPAYPGYPTPSASSPPPIPPPSPPPPPPPPYRPGDPTGGT